MSTSASSRHVRRLTHAALSAAVAAVVLQAAPAGAAPDSPVITGPGTTGPAVELTWEPVAVATGYEVRVDNDPAFASPEWTASTVNTVSVPTKMLAVGQQHVQVRARDAAGDWSAWSTHAFTVETVAGPAPTGPADGARLPQPAEPPLLTWEPVAGATGYTVEVDTEEQFVGPTTYTTDATALVVPDNQDPDVRYWWRVSATLADGVSTEHSVPRSYVLEPIDTPTITGPGDDADITDVVLDWEPVAGAKYYELEVDDDFDFSSPETAQVPTKIYGTQLLAPDHVRERPVLLAGPRPRPGRQPDRVGPPLGRRALRVRPGVARRPPARPPLRPVRRGRVRARRPVLRVDPRPARLALRGVAEHGPQLHRAHRQDGAVPRRRHDLHPG